MSNPFTPKEVVDRFRALGLTPVWGRYNAWITPGNKWAAWQDRCCALTVLFVGERVTEPQVEASIEFEVKKRWPEFNVTKFIDGFDGQGTWDEHSADFILGSDCRLALEAAFGPLRQGRS